MTRAALVNTSIAHSGTGSLPIANAPDGHSVCQTDGLARCHRRLAQLSLSASVLSGEHRQRQRQLQDGGCSLLVPHAALPKHLCCGGTCGGWLAERERLVLHIGALCAVHARDTAPHRAEVVLMRAGARASVAHDNHSSRRRLGRRRTKRSESTVTSMFVLLKRIVQNSCIRCRRARMCTTTSLKRTLPPWRAGAARPKPRPQHIISKIARESHAEGAWFAARIRARYSGQLRLLVDVCSRVQASGG